MARMTTAEQTLFAKYWGEPDLEKNEGFWDDVLAEFSKEHTKVHLPIQYNPQTTRRVLEDLDCPAGGCGKCCKGASVPITLSDIKRINENTHYSREYLKEAVIHIGDKAYIRQVDSGCPFLGLNVCTIYKYRPDACYLFPIVGAEDSIANGKKIKQMIIRIPCRQVLDMARRLLEGMLEDKGKMLLPNLVVIRKEEHNGTESSSN